MRKNAKWPPNGWRNVKFNPRATKQKLETLKIKSISNISAIKLYFLIFFSKRKF
jgi:hypothetical protein